jgi:uncharacterized membrane protein YhdT
MTPNPQIMTAVEQLGYRVTCGDVATKMGIQIEEARSGLLALANDTGGHLQVTNEGEIIYNLPQDFRQILNRKYWQLQLTTSLQSVWKVAAYLVRGSFGVLLVASIGVVYLAILAIAIAAICGSEGGGDCACTDGGFGSCVLDCGPTGGSSTVEKQQKKRLNFLESVFSFIFGDGNPNADLERRRWGYIGMLINQQRGAIIAEQIAPFLDDLGRGYDREYEQYMLPILTKFNGIPEVSPTGQLVYHFPDLQATLRSDSMDTDRIPACLQERRWKFSRANSGQIKGAIALGVTNIVGIIILSVMVSGSGSGLITGGLLVLATYGIGFLTIPSIRYWMVKAEDRQIRQRNRSRRQAINLITSDDAMREKLAFASQFANQRQLAPENIIYRTDEDAIERQDFL